MADGSPPKYRTGWLWAILTLLLVLGTAGSAFVVYGATGAATSGDWFPGVPVALGGAVVAILSLMLLAGMLYRVDRLRGVPHRVVRIFE